jgi:hypothetical protein
MYRILLVNSVVPDLGDERQTLTNVCQPASITVSQSFRHSV